jgi:outer membrane receptor protein involved in Fe transport
MSRRMRRRLFQSAVLAGVLSASGLASAASAQERTFTFDIPAESLSKSLRDFGQATHQQLVFTEDLTAGKTAPAVKGAYSAGGALAQILKGSGLSVERTPTGALVLHPVSNSAAVAPASEIVVTANKRIEPLSKIGEGISAISGDQLETMNASNLEDYLAFIPGVEFTSYGRPGQDQISIRGIASQALGAAIATYVDGIPVGSASNEAQGASYTVDIDPSDLERVEVLKGPQGTLYGASSLGGVLKYVTKTPSLTRTELDTGFDVEDVDHGGVGYKLRAASTTPIIADVLGIRVSGFYREDPGFIDNLLTGKKDVNSDEAWGVRASVLYQPTQQLSVRLGAVVQRTSADGLDAVSYNLSPSRPPPFVLSHGDLDTYLHHDQPNHAKDEIYSAEINYDLGWANLISETGYPIEDDYRYTDVTATYTRASYAKLLSEAAGSTASDINNYDVDKTSQELRLQSKTNDHFEWVAGFFYQDESSNTDAIITIMGPTGAVPAGTNGQPALGYAHNDLTEYAGFVNGTYYILPSVDVSAGYRRSHITQDNVNDDTGPVYTLSGTPAVRTDRLTNDVNIYSAGVRWRLTSDVMFYARAASGFRPGGGRGAPPIAGLTNFVPTYNPDTVWSYEAGVKAKALDGRVTLDVDAFYIDWRDIQTLIAVAGGPYLVEGNGGNAVSQGLEAQTQIRPFQGLTMTGSYAFTDAHYTTPNAGLGLVVGEQIQFVPKTTASLQVEYEHRLTEAWTGFIGGDYRYRSSELDALNLRMPGFDQWGLHAGATYGRTRVSLYVVNLADSRGLLGYTGGGNAVGDAFRYAVSPPRTVGFSVSQKW